MFFETLISTFLATVAGGAIASIVAYHLTRRASSIEATYEVVHHILSEDMTDKRRLAREGLQTWSAAEIAKAMDPADEPHATRKTIISVMNYYDVVFSGVKDGMLNEQTIRNSVWELIRDDHLLFEPFIRSYTEVVPSENRPLFPCLREYRDKWG